MEISEIKYTGNLHTEAVHLLSGTSISTDAPRDNEGKGESFSPTDLLAVSLGTCAVTTMAIKARKSGFELGNAMLKVAKHMQAQPRKVARVVVNIEIEGKYTDAQKEVLHQAAHQCPVALSLHPDTQQEIGIHYKHEKPL